MSSRVFEVLQQMLKLRKDRSIAQSKRVQAEYERVRAFNAFPLPCCCFVVFTIRPSAVQ